MDEHDKRRVGEQIEPGGRPKAPGRLELLQRFINSCNPEGIPTLKASPTGQGNVAERYVNKLKQWRGR